MITSFEGKSPKIEKAAFIAPTAVVLGDVTIGEGSSVWYNCVLRGDEHPIVIGERTNIQDLTMCHETSTVGPLTIGDDVTAGHRAILHGCTIGNRCLIGMGAVIMDGAVIGDDCIVAAGAVVLEGAVFQPGSLIAGLPAKFRRELNESDLALIRYSSEHYVMHARRHSELFAKNEK